MADVISMVILFFILDEIRMIKKFLIKEKKEK